ncbi:MAG: hypothetical protein WA667_24445 [Candidatus Nitrosopolaris sp.]
MTKDAAGNSTIKGLATKDLVNETLRQYGYAFGVANVREVVITEPVILVTQVVWVPLLICRFTRVHKCWLRRRTGC